jgi:hypothetical protein
VKDFLPVAQTVELELNCRIDELLVDILNFLGDALCTFFFVNLLVKRHFLLLQSKGDHEHELTLALGQKFSQSRIAIHIMINYRQFHWQLALVLALCVQQILDGKHLFVLRLCVLDSFLQLVSAIRLV